MTNLFLIICALSVVFFVVFLVQCSVPTRKAGRLQRRSRADHMVRRVARSEMLQVASGQGLFLRLEKEMAEFLAAHGRTAAALLVAMALVPFVALAQDQSGPSPDQGDSGSGDQTSTANQDIPPAVAKQLAAMQKRIDQLEHELKDRKSVV